jgi:serine/threonine-protein kinase
MNSQPTGHVFISYAREDQPYTRKLADSLRQRGFEVWVDDRIDFGDDWWEVIVQTIRASAAFVVIMTPNSEKSGWVKKEILLALEERKRAFPLLLRGQRFPIYIDIQYADVTDGRMPPDNFYERLAQVAPSKPMVEQRPPTRQLVAYQPAGRHGEPQVALPAILEHREPFEPELVLIPAGEFLMGSDPKKDEDTYEEEQPQHRLHLPDYYIAKAPVTDTQYLAFVQSTSYREPKNWDKGKPPGGKEDHPVVSVTWHDAMAYCRWLTKTTGRSYRLPSEAEWEKAARGTDGRIYPWGDESPDKNRCNFDKNLGDTTPVGQYSPRGDSHYGCVDTAGNVFEWTLSLWGKEKLDFKYPYDPQDGRENLEAGSDILRVCRGGAFYFSQRYVRCAFRGWNFPYGRYINLGFRVCVAAQ